MNTRKLLLSIASAVIAGTAHASTIINDSTGGWYNSGLGDMADYYGPGQFPAADVSEGDPTSNNVPEPTVFGPAFGDDWLAGDFNNGTWQYLSDIPNAWTVNNEVAVVYNFNLATTSDLLILLGVDNGIFVWLDGQFLLGATAGGGPALGEHQVTRAGVSSGAHSLQFILADHGSSTGFNIQVDATESTPSEVPLPGTLGLLGVGLAGLGLSRRRQVVKAQPSDSET
jgi:hypothetical protein